jgi:hypothetical protein
MDLVTLSKETGIALRRLRYTIFHVLVPGIRRVEVGRGSVRQFTEFEAFGLALATMLLDAGLKRDLVKKCIQVLAQGRRLGAPVSDVPLYQVFASRGPATVYIADRSYFRLRAGKAGGLKVLDTGWVRSGSQVARSDYDPVVVLSVNVAALRDTMRNTPSS